MTAQAEGEDASLITRAAARAVALDRDLTHTTLRVLKYLESLLNHELPIGIVQKNIAGELGGENRRGGPSDTTAPHQGHHRATARCKPESGASLQPELRKT
jgi:hypothetical protein